MLTKKLGFIGAGQMATALARGLIEARVTSAENVMAYDPAADAQQRFLEAVPGARWFDGNVSLVNSADVVVLAVKPQQVSDVAKNVRGQLSGKLLVSVAAGVRLENLTQSFDTDRIVRVMPNTPCLVGYGAAGFARGSGATDEDAAVVQQMFEAVGIAFSVSENLLDAVTGLSGSGPAYVALFIEALADGGVRMGLPRQVALELAAQTVRGTGELIVACRKSPADVKDQVASPGGTTIAGIQALEERAFRGAVMAAVIAATERARQLGG
jgi:pyrroline-5-carboxylate reductase